jgi:hypothetical protein
MKICRSMKVKLHAFSNTATRKNMALAHALPTFTARESVNGIY